MQIIDAGKVRIGVFATKVGGRYYVDIRAYTTDMTGMLRPTPNGVLLPVEQFDKILSAAKREYAQVLEMEPPLLYYFKEKVEDKHAPRHVHVCKVSATAKEAVRKTPEDYGAETSRGYIFRCRDYKLDNQTYTFEATKPYAVWDRTNKKWVRWR